MVGKKSGIDTCLRTTISLDFWFIGAKALANFKCTFINISVNFHTWAASVLCLSCLHIGRSLHQDGGTAMAASGQSQFARASGINIDKTRWLFRHHMLFGISLPRWASDTTTVSRARYFRRLYQLTFHGALLPASGVSAILINLSARPVNRHH